MLPRLYTASVDKAHYNNNGLGFLKDCTKCEITEERNGAYTLSMTVAATDPLIPKIAISQIIKAKANNEDNPQLFEITKIVVKSTGEYEITGQHIKYLYCQNCPETDGNYIDMIVKGTPTDVIKLVSEGGLMFESPFQFKSDIKQIKDFDLNDVKSGKIGDLLAGTDNSLVNVYEGEFHYDNFNVELLKSRGSDSGYRLMFGHNISDYTQTVTNDAEYSHIMGYAKITRSDDKDGYIVLTGDPVQSSTKRKFPKVKIIDFSSKIRDYFGGDFKVNPQTGLHMSNIRDMLLNFTNEYMISDENCRTDAEVNIKVTYEPELDKMQNLKLCDTVNVCFNEYTPPIKAKISKVVYDSLAERYTLMEIGEQKVSLLNFIKNKRR